MAQISFNYSQVKNSEAAKQAQQSAKQIRQILEKSAESVVQIGRLMATVKAGLTPAVFRAWLECEFGWRPAVACNYMQAAHKFGDLDCLKLFQPSALIALARKNVPEAAVTRAIDLARAGDLVTHTVAKRLLDETGHKPTNPTAGKARKPESLRSIARPAFTVPQLRDSLDACAATLPKLTLTPDERQALMMKFMELMTLLQSQPVEPTVPAKSTRSSAKPASKKPAKAAKA